MGRKKILGNVLSSAEILSIQKCLANPCVFLKGFSHVRKSFQAIFGILSQVDAESVEEEMVKV